MSVPGNGLNGRFRRAAAWCIDPWIPTARVIRVRCPYCTRWRAARHFRRGARYCRACSGNG